ncbi:hypothetical protein Q9R23_05075 [Exiguobacterium sp. BRG2]|uniref:hypothetical protein n=1 Tax=Exiguobacterium sp. BRG2 TaxID=2962584 RepID=UPI0028822E8B|nr:hypothetical protein [Exiguobacterium sp. BRG2]MDT0172336.1 hypothetical protein [Exiguobacterium sp. BRG2]
MKGTRTHKFTRKYLSSTKIDVKKMYKQEKIENFNDKSVKMVDLGNKYMEISISDNFEN